MFFFEIEEEAEVIETAVERYQDSWSEDSVKSIRDFIPAAHDYHTVALFALLFVDLELAVRCDLNRKPEWYLREFPDLRLCTPVAHEFLCRAFELLEQNRGVSWSEFLSSLPKKWASQLRPPRKYESWNEKIGEGGQAEIWRSTEIALERDVAVKVPKQESEPRDAELIRTEARITSALEHPSIVPVYGTDISPDGKFVYAMRLIRWPDLSALIRVSFSNSGGEWLNGESVRKLLRHFVSVCNAVAYANKKGYLHLDLKPSNVKTGNFGETMLMDWGLTQPSVRARRVDLEDAGQPKEKLAPQTSETSTSTLPLHELKHHLKTGERLGTPAYMSPEQASGEIRLFEERTDVFGLGATLFHILVNRPPFVLKDKSEVMEFWDRVQRCEHPRPRSLYAKIPKQLEAICLKSMSPEQESRYSGAKELAEDIERYLAGEQVKAYPENGIERLYRWCRRNLRKIATVLLLFIVSLVTGFLVYGISLKKIEYTRIQSSIQSIGSVDGSQLEIELARLSDDTAIGSRVKQVLSDSKASTNFDSKTLRRLSLLAATSDIKFARLLLKDAVQVESLEEFSLILQHVAQLEDIPHSQIDAWWASLSPASKNERLRIYALLSNCVAEDSQVWSAHFDTLAELIVSTPPAERLFWQGIFEGFSASLTKSLAQIGSDADLPIGIQNAASIIWADYLSGDVEALVASISNASPVQHFALMDQLVRQRDQATALLKQKSISIAKRVVVGKSKSADLQQHAMVELALLRLGGEDFDWRLLRRSKTPSMRTMLILMMHEYAVPYEFLVSQFHRLDKEDEQAAVLMGLGSYSNTALPMESKVRVRDEIQLQQLAITESGELRAAAEWLMKKWFSEIDLETDDSKNKHRLVRFDRNTLGESFMMGGDRVSAVVLPGSDIPLAHRRRIGREFEIATCETTVQQYEAFLKDYFKDDPEMPFPVESWLDDKTRQQFSLSADCPAVYVNWLQAATYCNWLSRKVGLKPAYPIEIEELAFVPNLGVEDQIALPELQPDVLLSSGFRLPTEAEWEFACRANTTSDWHLGNESECVNAFAHTRLASSVAPKPVGFLLPNPFGLFDMHGNAMEICHSVELFPQQMDDSLWHDGNYTNGVIALRGGSSQNLPGSVQSAIRVEENAYISAIDVGFRIARTHIEGRESLEKKEQ